MGGFKLRRHLTWSWNADKSSILFETSRCVCSISTTCTLDLFTHFSPPRHSGVPGVNQASKVVGTWGLLTPQWGEIVQSKIASITDWIHPELYLLPKGGNRPIASAWVKRHSFKWDCRSCVTLLHETSIKVPLNKNHLTATSHFKHYRTLK